MEHLHQFISNNAIMTSAIILIVAYIFIALEKIPKVVIALLGGSLTLFLGLLATEKTPDNLGEYFISFIDFNVIFLLVSMMIIVHIASKSGMFTWLANEILKKTKGHPIAVLASLAVFTAVASAFLDNVTTVILVMPITFAACKLLDINPIPFLITEIFCSNIGGTATLIGDPPNIIIGSAANFSFMDFVKELTGVVALIMLVIIALMVFIYRKELKSSPEKMELVSQIDNSKTIEDKALAIRSGIVLALVIVGFVSHDVTHIPTFLSAMIGASILLIFEKPAKVLVEVEWNTIFFFVGLFIIIGGLEASGGIALMAKWILDITHGSQSMASMIILWASGILSGIIDNIPYTATMAPMIATIEQSMGHAYVHPLWWSLALGACLGGNMTIIGAAANVIVSENAAKAGHPISFMKFLKYGIIVTAISLAISTVYIYFRFLVH
ncbi:MAG: ArsB/NhaD family transporter [Candidatus Gastranaerophilales bacterium]|nr:ArsB/NhaD family transporter [Candidatus Gastranaerophilales bacterium]